MEVMNLFREARQKFGGKKATAKRGTKKSGKDAHLSDSNSREVTEVRRNTCRYNILVENYVTIESMSFRASPGCIL